jgi:HD-like signal output (HDOD) protein
MKSWTNSFFPKETSAKMSCAMSVEQNKAIESSPSKHAKIKSKPLSSSHEKLPLSVLKKLAPIRDLDERDLAQIDQTILTFVQNSVVFLRGDKSDSIYYLLQGSVKIELGGGSKDYIVQENSPLARLPLNSGKICNGTAIAQSTAMFLVIPGTVTQWWINKSRAKQQETELEIINIDLPDAIPNTEFFQNFTQAYRENKLSLPTLPQVAMKLRRAMQNEEVTVDRVVGIIQVDAPIVAKLIQVSNSVLYSSSVPIKNCHDAVARIGVDATRKLVMGITVKQLFKSKSPSLMAKMQELWHRSLHISSLSFVLAQEDGRVKAEDALLAGLVCDIGAIPLIHFAEQHPQDYPGFHLEELEMAMPYLNPPVGALVLNTLGFSKEIVEVVKHAEDWYYESTDAFLTLADVIILAKRHSYFGSERSKTLPAIQDLPAYRKLKNSTLTPDFSLDILVKAQQRIDAAMSLLS